MRKTILIFMALIAMMAKGQLVDWHCHNVMPDFVSALERHNAQMDENFPLPHWDVESHLAFMDSAGIKTSVLSMPAPQPWWGDGEESEQICRQYNDETASICLQYPGRFQFVAALPLPDVERSISESEYAMNELGALGVKLPSNSRGLYLGAPKLEPLMAKLNDLKATVVIHPHKPDPVNESLISATPMAMGEYLAETTRAVMNMISHNVPARYPDIKWVIPHCGSFLPLELPRYESLIPLAEKMHLLPVDTVDIKQNTANFYYDTAGAPTAAVISSLLNITTPDHLLYGSDYPYVAVPVLLNNIKKMESADNTDAMLIRISEIEVYPEYLDEYLTFAKNVGAESVKKEPGVIAIYPMAQQRDSCQIRILEIYRDMDAYKQHIASDHFQTYKQGTLHMVKSLDLVDMHPLDPAAMPLIFRKMQ